MKAITTAAVLVPLLFCSCTTLANRRDIYGCRGKVDGPYTRLLRDGVPGKPTVKLVPVQSTTAVSDGKTYAPPR